jgi:hypothetical protein
MENAHGLAPWGRGNTHFGVCLMIHAGLIGARTAKELVDAENAIHARNQGESRQREYGIDRGERALSFLYMAFTDTAADYCWTSSSFQNGSSS